MKVIKTSNAKSSQFVEEKVTFSANNVFAEKYSDGTYAVYSYGYHFPMYVYHEGEWYENSTKYSVSTSKQQTHARPSYNCKKATTQELQKMLVANPVI